MRDVINPKPKIKKNRVTVHPHVEFDLSTTTFLWVR